MAIDLSKIRERLNKLSSKDQKKSDLWSPEEGVPTNIRIVPWPDGNNGDPFKERWFYYGVGAGRSIPCPFQYEKPDPINELRQKLRDEGTKEAYALREKFKPSRRFYAPAVVRGKEDEGVKLWGFSKGVANSLYEEMMDEDVGDITDPKSGFDIKVTKSKTDGAFATVKVKTARTPSPLHEDSKKAAEFLSNVPNIDEIYSQMEYEEIEKRMNDVINAETQAESDGTETSSVVSEKAAVVTKEESTTIDSVFDDLDDMIES